MPRWILSSWPPQEQVPDISETQLHARPNDSGSTDHPLPTVETDGQTFPTLQRPPVPTPSATEVVPDEATDGPFATLIGPSARLAPSSAATAGGAEAATEEHPPTVMGTPSSERAYVPPPLFPCVPGYEVLGELGRGGMGVVYKARQVGLNRVVALKMILHAGHAGREARDRFLVEAESVARLQHPNIVQVHEIGEHDGAPFFSLEFCPGGSLDRKLDGTPLEPRKAAELLETLARAVHAAHQAQVIHRDLKPANVLLGADGTPKITDFGLAKKLDADTGQTQHGAIMGTPSYMAPEQASGALDQVGPLSDVYSLAAILYEFLTGHSPFRAATVWDTLDQVRTQEPVPPRRLQPRCPLDLETVCLKGLQKAPRKRYASALELAGDLRAFLDGRTIQARRTPTWERAWKWTRRKPALAALAVAVFLAILFASGGGLFYGLYKDQQLTLQRQATEQEKKETARQRQVESLLARGKEADVLGRLALKEERQEEAGLRFQEADEHFKGALALLDEEADRQRRADVLRWHERVRGHLDEQARRRRWQDRLRAFWDDRHEVLFGAVSPTLRDEVDNRARVLRLASAALGRLGVRAEQTPAETGRALEKTGIRFAPAHERARVVEGCYEVLLVWADAIAAPAGPGGTARQRARQALHLLELADALGNTHGLKVVPRAFYERRARYRDLAGEAGAQADRTRARGLAPTAALDHFLEALQAWKQNRVRDALRGCEQALSLQSDHFWAQYVQALCHLKARKWDLARASLTGCLARRPDFLWARLLRASALVEDRETDRAEADFGLVLERATTPLTRYVALVNRSVLRLRQNRPREALADLRLAVELRPGGHEAHVNMAQVHEHQQDWAKAAAALGKAIEQRPAPALYYTRARAHLKRGDTRSARADFDQTIARASADSPSGLLLSALVERGYLKHKAGEHAAALADFDGALRLRSDFADAHRQRAETLLALGRYAEAGKALDHYLAGRQREAEFYRARGMIHSRLGEHRQAIELYNAALLVKQKGQPHQEALTLELRGWAYLQTDAVGLALADLDGALERGPKTYRGLCGRALARVRLRQVPEALKDADGALKLPEATGPDPVLLAACVYARAATLTAQSMPRARRRWPSSTACADRAVELLAEALRRVPREEQTAFWRTRVQNEEALAEVRQHARIVGLARRFERH